MNNYTEFLKGLQSLQGENTLKDRLLLSLPVTVKGILKL